VGQVVLASVVGIVWTAHCAIPTTPLCSTLIYHDGKVHNGLLLLLLLHVVVVCVHIVYFDRPSPTTASAGTKERERDERVRIYVCLCVCTHSAHQQQITHILTLNLLLFLSLLAYGPQLFVLTGHLKLV